VIKNADMSEDMQQEAVDCASQALSKYNIEKVSREVFFFWKQQYQDNENLSFHGVRYDVS
jgi:Dynein light chain type 1.